MNDLAIRPEPAATAPIPEAPPPVQISAVPMKIAAAINAIMTEIPTIEKRGVNKFHNYKFVQVADVLQAVTPLLSKHGLMILQTELGRAMFDEGKAIAVQYSFTLAHISGEVWPEQPRQTGMSACRNTKGGFDDKAINKCHTAARKYFLMALFQIPTGDADDADRGDNDRGSARGRKPPEPAPNPMDARGAPLDYDEDGIVRDPPTDGPPSTAEDAPPSSAREPHESSLPTQAPGGVSIEAQAREMAQRGAEAFNNWYRRLPPQQKPFINAIGDELREIMGPKKEETAERGP